MGLDAYDLGAAAAVAVLVWLVVPPAARAERRLPGATPPPWRWLAGRSDAAIGGGRRGVAAVCIGGVVVLLLADDLGLVAGALGAVVAGSVWVALGWLEPLHVRRRRWRMLLEIPHVLDLLGAGLAAGLPLRSAAAAVVRACPGPVADELQQVLNQVAVGVGDADAWRTLADHPQLGPVAADLARSVESGTMMVETLAVHAAQAREERRGAMEVQARRVGVRSVLPLMLCFIPAFLLLGIVPTVVSAVERALEF